MRMTSVGSAARAMLRSLRRRRGIRRAARVIDRWRWTRVILAADLIDLDYVEAQLGRRLTARQAARTYVRRGFQTGMRLNPLFVDVTVGDHLPGVNEVPALYAYLVNSPIGIQVSPLWDAGEYLRRHPDRATEPGGAVGAVWRRRATESLPFGPGAAPAPLSWTSLHNVVIAAATATRRRAELDVGATRESDGALITILGPEETDFDETLVDTAEYVRGGGSAAIIVADGQTDSAVQAAVLATLEPGVRALLRPTRSWQQSIAAAIGDMSSDVVIVRGPNLAMDASTVAALAAQASSGAIASPLWLDIDGTIVAAGNDARGRLLVGHPAEDAGTIAHSGPVRVPSLIGAAFAARRHLLADLEIFVAGDVVKAPGLVDAPILFHPGLVVRSRHRAVVHEPVSDGDGARRLFTQGGWVPAERGWRRSEREAFLADGTRVPVLRWAIRTAAPAGPRGEWWGDTHFARALADALRRLGQEVVIDSYAARNRLTSHIDDVTLVLRGPEPIDPPVTGLSILWVISHPEQQTAASLTAFDLVFAASTPWSVAASQRFGVDVGPLLQCTDVQRFHPSGRPRGTDIVFVGTARGIPRPSIIEPVLAGIPVRVYGPDWRGWIPAEAIAGLGMPNAELPALYEGAAAVLNDHWPAMRQHGFIANRPFDVVAAGGRVVSDHVDGIPEIFGGAVATYSSTDELLTILRGNLDDAFPSEGELARIGHRIREEHSFDSRARTLLDAALRAR